MNKQELIDEINKTKEHLANMKKLLEECEYERWKPKCRERYYYISERGTAVEITTWAECIMAGHYDFYNCFKTEEEAKAEAEKILVRRMLEDIARRLNKGREINWYDEAQLKWYICYDDTDGIVTYSVCGARTQGTIYCLDDNFFEVAIQEIGEERLKKYLGGE